MFLTVILLFLSVILGKLTEAQSVTCTYVIFDETYTCLLANQNIQNVEQLVVDGEHLDGYNDDNVTRLSGGNSTIRVFPSPIIDHFVNLEEALFAVNSDSFIFGPQIQRCLALKNVVIVLNELTEIPDGIFQNCANLLTLRFDFNSITTISPNAFNGLTNLAILSLVVNRIESLDAQVFTPLASLTTLDLRLNRIQDLHPQAFASLTKLTNLDLRSNRIASWNDALLSQNSELQSLDLSFNQITSLTDRSFTKLLNLDISVNRLTEIPLLEGLTSLENLTVYANQIRNVSIDSFRFMQNLILLDLEGNWIANVDFKLRSTHTLPSLQEIIFRSNHIHNLQEEAFSGLPNISRLVLSFNTIERLVAYSLPTTSLRYLDLRNNRISRLDRQLFVNASNLELIMNGNVCFNSNLTIGIGINDATEASLQRCFNSAASLTMNIFAMATSVVGVALFLL